MRQIQFFFGIFVGVFSFFPVVGAQEFPDVVGHEFAYSIAWLRGQGVVEGYPDGNFGPDRGISRAEILKILLLASGRAVDATAGNCFSDVGEEWFVEFVCSAAEQGIVRGYPDGIFRPGRGVTVAEAYKMAIESFGLDVEEGGAFWFSNFVDFVHEQGIFRRGRWTPDAAMTRGAMAFLVEKLSEVDKSWQVVWDFRSAGCGLEPPRQNPESLVVSGVERRFITVVGENYDKNFPEKLIFAFHGRTNSNEQVRRYYDVEDVWDGRGIVVYPLGLPEEGPSRRRGDPGDDLENLRDFAFFDAMLEFFSENYCVDLDQVFVVGHSLGAWFTNSLACGRGGVIRGIGSVGGAMELGACRGRVAAIVMHNPADRLASFAGSELVRDSLIRQNSCENERISVGPDWANCQKFVGCAEPVLWCPHEDDTGFDGRYYPHNRPDFAMEEIWNFWESL